MRKLLFLILLVGSIQSLQAQFTIPDPAFAAKLQQIVPNAMNGNVLDTNHIDVTSMTTLGVAFEGISDLSGVQFFDSLQDLNCRFNQLTSIPVLPSGLQVLDCGSNQLTGFSPLPSSLEALRCVGNQLTSLPVLPSSLEVLICNFNQLTSLPALPSLLLIECDYNQLTTLPVLPSSLVMLWCNGNLLTSLPSLPSSLEELRCNDNQLTNLPSLPNSLLNLYCYANQLTSLPSLPSSLTFLCCDQNQLVSLPPLPNSLERLYCHNNQLPCLPVLPDSLDVLHCQGNFISCLPNFPTLLPPFGSSSGYETNLGFSPVYCTPSGSCFPSESVTGVVFNDSNGNAQWDSGETPFWTGVVAAQPSSNLSGTDVNGSYVLILDTGLYTVQGQTVPYHNITTPAHSVTITPGHIDSLNHIGYQPIPGIYDLVVEIDAQVTRPGFDNNVYLQVKNIGTETTTAAIDLGFDTDQTWVSSTILPTSQSGSTASWSVPMDPGDIWNTAVTLNTAASVALGTSIYHWLAATPSVSDSTPADNSTNWNALVVGSYDPNDKTAVPSSMNPTQLLSGDAIEYTIRFQNTGTFMAENVRITDTLSSDLEWGSFEYISSSHSNYWYLSNGVLVFQHDNIQLPDSTSDGPNSHGFVKFRIKPSQNLLVGDSVLNTANIFFDFNEPVITDPSVFIIDITSGVEVSSSSGLQVYPNPTTGLLNLRSESDMQRVTIYQLDGRLLRSEQASGVQHQVQLAELKQGLYLLEVETDGGRFTSRVLKR